MVHDLNGRIPSFFGRARDPFATPPANIRYLRIAAIHRYEFERQQRVDSGRLTDPTSRRQGSDSHALAGLRRV